MENKLNGKRIRKVIERASETGDIWLCEQIDGSKVYLQKTDIKNFKEEN